MSLFSKLARSVLLLTLLTGVRLINYGFLVGEDGSHVGLLVPIVRLIGELILNSTLAPLPFLKLSLGSNKWTCSRFSLNETARFCLKF